MSLLLMLLENSDISLTIHRRKNRQHWQTQFLHPNVLDLSCCFWKLLSLVLSPLSGLNMCRHKASYQNDLSGSSNTYKANLSLITNGYKRKAFKGSFFFLIIQIFFFNFQDGCFLVVQVRGCTCLALQFSFIIIIVFGKFLREFW